MANLLRSLIFSLFLLELLELLELTECRTTKFLINRSNETSFEIQQELKNLNDTESSFELIKSSKNNSSNDTDSRKSENLHLLHRLIDRLHQIHNRHHHHHLHHISSSSSNSIFDRPFRLFDRQTDDSYTARDFDNSFAGGGRGFNGEPFRRPMFNRGGPPMEGGFNRQFGGPNRPWLRRQKRSLDDNLDNGIDEYLEQLNYKKIKLNNQSSKQLHNSSINHQSSSSTVNNKTSSFKPINTFKPSKFKSQSMNLSSRSAYVYNHLNPLSYSFNSKLKSPSIITSTKSSSLKFNSPITTPSSNSQFLTTSSSSTVKNQDHTSNSNNNNLFDPLNPFNSFRLFNSIDKFNPYTSHNLPPINGGAFDASMYDSTHHHYYHQAYLLYKYFKLYKDKSLNEINWSTLPDEIRDKFKMLILSLRYAKSENANNVNSNNSNNLNTLDNWNEDYVISKALEIVKWKGWKQKQKEEFEMNRNYMKPFVPINQQHSQSISHLNNQLINRKSTNDNFINKPILDNSLSLQTDKNRNQTKKYELKLDEIKQNSIQSITKHAQSTTTTSINQQQNIIDQIDDIDTVNGYSDDKYANTIQNTYTPLSYFNKANSISTSTTISPLTTTLSTNEALKKAFENIEDIRTNHSCSKPRGRLFNLKEMNPDYRFYLPK